MTGTVYRNPAARTWQATPPPHVLDFHRSLPSYAPTRLVETPTLAAELGAARVFVKEEAARLGLPAFKILGASYATARALSARWGADGVLGLAELRNLAPSRPPVELVAATDGNHGRAVAHMARLVGLAARIFTPAGITATAKAAIESEGARRIEIARPYDDVVTAAAEAAAESPDALLIQDTSWPGYEDVPRWIVDGYSTLLVEADAQLAAAGVPPPDVVAVPVGVGSLAHCVVQYYRSVAHPPTVLSVEPDAAPAILTSLRAGESTTVATGSTSMAGLNCGTPTAIGWPVLRDGLDAAVTVTDADTARAVRDLESVGVDSGPCGAATLAGVRALSAADPLPGDAVVLLLSTEGRGANPLPGQD
jgi:diaminopropionate ammonia-lyase